MKKFYSLAMFATRLEGTGLVFFVFASVTSAYSKEEAEQIATEKIKETCKESEGWDQHLVSANEFTIEQRHFTTNQDNGADALVM